jgi:hypothetical protein
VDRVISERTLAAGFPDPAIGKLSAAFTDLVKLFGRRRP